MATAATQLEGTWEEILDRAAEFAGRRVRVTVLNDKDVSFADGPQERRSKLLAWLDEQKRTPLSDEELRALDEFDEFRKVHPFRLRRLDQGG